MGFQGRRALAPGPCSERSIALSSSDRHWPEREKVLTLHRQHVAENGLAALSGPMRVTGYLPDGIKFAVVDPGQAEGADRLNAMGLGALSTVTTVMTVKDL